MYQIERNPLSTELCVSVTGLLFLAGFTLQQRYHVKEKPYLWKRWPQGNFLAAAIESQQIAQSSLFLISSSSVAKGNLVI